MLGTTFKSFMMVKSITYSLTPTIDSLKIGMKKLRSVLINLKNLALKNLYSQHTYPLMIQR